VAIHADIAARLLENFVKRKQHYDDAVIPAIRDIGSAGAEDRVLEGAWNAIASQLLSTQDELLRLMEDAKTQGTEALQRRGRQAGPKLDLTLTPPSSADPREVAATLYVMWDGLRGAARDAADELDRLIAWLSRCADPVAAQFVVQLSALAGQLRPPNVPPGPYAPGPVEIDGPRQHAALMSRYGVTVVAAFKAQVELMNIMSGSLPEKSFGAPDFGPLAKDMNVKEDTTFDPPLFTLTVSYPAGGQGDEQARQFALELFKRDCDRHSLPEPDRLSISVTAS
jgi:hypothetical protein